MTERTNAFGFTTPEEVQERMLLEFPEYGSAAQLIETSYDPTIPQDSLDVLDTSFARQIRQLVHEPQSVHPELSTAPDAYVVTANSAIPVAASIRGYYRTLGHPIPHITFVKADRAAARNYVFRGELDDTEIGRLSKELDGAEHVAAVDQFVLSGQTIRCAAVLLHRAGVRQVSGIRGRWYPQINPGDVDTETVSSEVDSFMMRIGEKAVQST